MRLPGAILLTILISMACAAPKRSPVDAMTRKDINEVLREHDQELMAIPGVVGVYVGLMPDKKSPCLKVMVVKKTKELKKKIPASLGGYPVVTEESGVIRPRNDRNP